MNRDAAHEFRKTSFSLEPFQKVRLLNCLQSVYCDSTCQIDSARSQELRGKIASFTAQDRHQQAEGFGTQFASVRGVDSRIDNHD